MEHYRRLGFAEKVRAAGPAGRLSDRHRLFHPLHQARTGPLQPAVGARRARDDQDPDRLVERGRTAAPRVADVRRGRAARARPRRCPTRIDPARLANDRACATPARGVEVDAEHDGGARTTLRAAYAIGADGGAQPDPQGAGPQLRRRKRRGARLHGRARCSRSISAAASSTTSSRIRAPGCTGRSTATAAPSWPRVNGRDEFTFHTQLRPGRAARADLRRARPRRCSTSALAAPLDIEIIARSTWNAGYTLVADELPARPHLPRRRRRASVHADRRAWLQHRGRGCGQSRLEARRRCSRAGAARRCSTATRPSGRRSRSATPPTRAALRIRSGCSCPPPEIEDDSPAGEAARKIAGDHLNRHARARVQHSRHHLRRPLRRLADRRVRTAPRRRPMPPTPTSPTACPGGRAPHLWLADGRSLYDAFGFEFTLLRLGADAPPTQRRSRPQRRRRACR